MNKFLTSIVALLLCITATAQTDFRHITYQEALAAAKSEGKLVFMDFYTDWCGPCKMMMKNVFPQTTVGEFMNKSFVNLKVNAEKGEGVELAKQYEVKAYPTFVVVDATGKEQGRTVGSSTAEAFISKLEAIIDPSKSPEVVTRKYESGDRTAQIVKAYASNRLEKLRETRMTSDEYKQRADSVTALVQDYFTALADADKVKEENMFVYRSYTDTPFSASGRFLCTATDKFAGAQRTEADSLVINLYKAEVSRLLYGSATISAENFKTLKQDIKKKGLDKDGSYPAAYALIECEGKGDLAAYVAECEKVYPKLTEDQRAYIMEGYASHFKTATDDVKKQAAQFLRRHIGEMPYNVIYFTAMQIGELEGMGH